MSADSPRYIYQLVQRQAATVPTGSAIAHGIAEPLSWQAYAQAVDEAAAQLVSRGIVSGDRILIVAENAVSTAVFIFAASKAGGIAVPINARMSAQEIALMQEHASPRVIVFTVGESDEAAEHAIAAQAQTHTLSFGSVAFVTLDTTLNIGKEEIGDTAVILYTTGTTGAPKGVMLTHANLLFAGQTSATLRGMAGNDRVYGALPLTHVFGLASMLMASACAGACVQLETRFSPQKLYEALMNGATVLPAVPQMHALLMQYAKEQGLTRLENSRLRYVSSGAAPLDPAWKRKAEAFYGIALQNGYGMTECTAGISGTRNTTSNPDVSAGRPMPGIEIRIEPLGNKGAKAGEGEILTRGPHVMHGYFRNPVATADTIDAEGYLRTGDIGWLDDEGQLHISGRCKELIIRNGFNVFPPEVESALNDHPDVVQSAVIGRAVDGGNEDILAFVQCLVDSCVDEVTLKAFVAEQLTGYKCPTHVFLVDQLPAAATGKILKHRLMTVFADMVGGV